MSTNDPITRFGVRFDSAAGTVDLALNGEIVATIDLSSPSGWFAEFDGDDLWVFEAGKVLPDLGSTPFPRPTDGAAQDAALFSAKYGIGVDGLNRLLNEHLRDLRENPQ